MNRSHDDAGSGPWEGHRRGSPGYRRILVALTCAGVATFAQLYSVQAVLPLLAQDLDVSAAQAALTVSAATLGLALAVIPWSAVADRLGRLRTMTVAIGAAVVLGLAVPAATDFGVLLGLRFLEGAALGGVPAVALAYLSEEVSRLHSAVAAGTYVAGTTIGGLAGRLIAGPLAELANWRIGVAAVSILSAAAAVAFVLTAPRQRGFTAAASRGLGGRLAANLVNPGLLVLYAQAFLLMGGFVAVYNYLGFRLSAGPFNLPYSVVSSIFLAYLAGTVSSRVAGGLGARYGRKAVLLGSIAVMLLGLALTASGALAVVLVGLVVFTAGFFGAHSVASGWTPYLACSGPAQASSLYNLFYYAGSSLFGWLGGLVFQRSGWTGFAVYVGALVVAAGLAALTLRPEGTAERPPAPLR